MSFLKSFFQSSNKHKKLCEEWTHNREPVVDGVTFYVRYLGSSLVDDPKSSHSTAAGVKRVIHAAKAGSRRPERVALRVAMEGVRIEYTSTGETLMDTSIYKISYCSADSQYDQVLAFVSSNDDETCECHAFLCSKRKVAEAIAVSIAQAFTMAYECWKLTLEAKQNGQKTYTAEQVTTRGEDSPSRLSKDGRNSRESSPGFSPGRSSPPSEVSSTSGYQSSTAGGMLLELDFNDGSHGTSMQQLCVGGSRKHWIDFGSSDGLVPVGSRYGTHSVTNLWSFPSLESPASEQSLAATSGAKSTSGGGSTDAAACQPRRNCSFNSRLGIGRYSMSDSEQKLLGAVN